MKINYVSLPLKGKCHCGSVKFEIKTNIQGLRRHFGRSQDKPRY